MVPLDGDALPVGLLRTDAAGIVTEANAWFTRWARRDPVGRPLAELLAPIDDFLDGAGRISRMMADPADHARAVLAVRGPDGDGEILTILDASDRYEAGLQLRSSHRLADRTRTRLELVIDASIAFSQASTEGRLAEILALTAARAYRAEESVVLLMGPDGSLYQAAGTNPFAERLDQGTLADGIRQLSQVLKISGTDEAEVLSPTLARIMQESGVRSVIAAPLHLDDGNAGVFACFFRHERQFDQEAAPLADALAGQAARALATIRLQRRLEHAAMHDETTDLPNRRYLEVRTPGLGEGGPVAVIFLDLDGFKSVNDRFGHQNGDHVLREVGRRLQSVVREQDVVARYGGDEFVVICDAADPVLAADIAERLRQAVEAPYPFLPEGIDLAASVGVAIGAIRGGGLPVDRLIREADQAMYSAKSTGGNRVVQLV